MNAADLSRRGWLARIGGAALSNWTAGGLPGADPDPLPPGLYRPSVQHLAHLMKASAAPAVPEGPRYFLNEDFRLVAALVALILEEESSAPVVLEISAWIDLIAGRAPEVRQAARSLSPAHRRLAVDYYGEDTVRELESQDVRKLLRDGLAALHQAGFGTLHPAAQLAHLSKMEEAGDVFLSWMKRRTLEGFYTSRQGLAELQYMGNSFYSRCPGCDHDGGHPGGE